MRLWEKSKLGAGYGRQRGRFPKERKKGGGGTLGSNSEKRVFLRPEREI